MNRVRHLDLFSGIGGFALAARRVGWETVGFCDNDPFCQAVLRQHWPDVPIYDDVRTFDATAARPVDIVTGGYPCQPFSLAGKRGGASDDRHLWPAMHRIIDEIRPTWVVGENVAGHLSMGLDDVLSDLERSGYAVRTFAIPAVAVDAKHRRERLWIVAHADDAGLQGRDGAVMRERAGERIAGASGASLADPARDEQGRIEQWPQRERARARGESEPVADTIGERQPQPQGAESSERRRARDGSGDVSDADIESSRRPPEPRQEHCEWEPEPDVGRVAHGIPARVDRLRSLGNAIVPQVAEEIFRAIDAIRMIPRAVSGAGAGARR